jgi:hypothetical protein
VERLALSHDPLFLRLEPGRPAGDNERGFAAELADPAWMLGRQWQLGEHQGENASSPLSVHLGVHRVPIAPLPSRPDTDPRNVPAEAIVESGAEDWWTVGRRSRLGLAAEQAGLPAALGGDAEFRFDGLTGPYEVLNGVAYDGRKLYLRAPDDPVFAEVPAPVEDLWSTESLAYTASFPCGGAELTVGGVDGGPTGRWGGHDGGDVDWWSADSNGVVEPEAGVVAEPLERWPDRFSWPGAPAPRWWQIEDHKVDLGGLPPDRAHLASTLLLDLVFGHADDWFLVPVRSQVGHVLYLEEVEITDSFGETWPKPATPWAAAEDWTMFKVSGLAARQLPIWPVAAAPLVGDPFEEVLVGMDEDANLVWAVEERLAGRVTDRLRPELPPGHVVDDDAHPEPPPPYRYEPATAVPDHWHPYTREEHDGTVRFVQGRLVAVTHDGTPTRRDPPTAALLQPQDPGLHTLAPWRLPPTGVRLEARPALARTTTGAPVLWVQRRRQPVLSVPSSGLRFDAVFPSESADRPAP